MGWMGTQLYGCWESADVICPPIKLCVRLTDEFRQLQVYTRLQTLKRAYSPLDGRHGRASKSGVILAWLLTCHAPLPSACPAASQGAIAAKVCGGVAPNCKPSSSQPSEWTVQGVG